MMERLRSQETGIFKKKPSDLMQIFKDVQTKVSDVVLGKEKPVEESNPEYEKLKHYVFESENHLAEAQKHEYHLVKRNRELGQSLSDFGKAAKLLGACEGNALGKAFTNLGTKSKLLSIKLQKKAQQLLMNFEEPLKDYVCAVQSIKATIAERANAFKQQCELAETIKLKEINLKEMSTYYLEHAGVHHLQKQFDLFEEEARSLLAFGLAIPAYDQLLKTSHAFNILDSIGFVGVAERARYFGQMSSLARQCAQLWLKTRESLGLPLGVVSEPSNLICPKERKHLLRRLIMRWHWSMPQKVE